MSRTPEQNIAAVMAYLRDTDPKREQFEKVTRHDIEAMQARLDNLEGHIAELEARLDELTPYGVGVAPKSAGSCSWTPPCFPRAENAPLEESIK